MYKRMKAVTLNKYGKPDALQLVDIEMPIPKEDEVLIKIDAIPVTTEDPLQRMGRPYFTRLFLGLPNLKTPYWALNFPVK